ncbi:MAG: hypothetical protein QM204_01445 [Bacillota bacterium]|jgi:hypothetical protein|nr:hypothetical protein [Bacillota bacterium]
MVKLSSSEKARRAISFLKFNGIKEGLKMRKLLTILFLIVTLFGCDNNDDARELDKEKYNAYLTYYSAILAAENKLTESQCFDIELVVNKLSENEYRYDVIIDNPRVAMFNIKALAIIETLSLEIDKENMMPSVGILDDYRYNMVPGQVDVKNEFYEGIILSLTSKESSLRVSVMVDYKPLNDEQAVRQYFSLYTEYEEIEEPTGE